MHTQNLQSISITIKNNKPVLVEAHQQHCHHQYHRNHDYCVQQGFPRNLAVRGARRVKRGVHQVVAVRLVSVERN